jgi:hypothetical protein
VYLLLMMLLLLLLHRRQLYANLYLFTVYLDNNLPYS